MRLYALDARRTGVPARSLSCGTAAGRLRTACMVSASMRSRGWTGRPRERFASPCIPECRGLACSASVPPPKERSCFRDVPSEPSPAWLRNLRGGRLRRSVSACARIAGLPCGNHSGMAPQGWRIYPQKPRLEACVIGADLRSGLPRRGRACRPESPPVQRGPGCGIACPSWRGRVRIRGAERLSFAVPFASDLPFPCLRVCRSHGCERLFAVPYEAAFCWAYSL